MCSNLCIIFSTVHNNYCYLLHVCSRLNHTLSLQRRKFTILALLPLLTAIWVLGHLANDFLWPNMTVLNLDYFCPPKFRILFN